MRTATIVLFVFGVVLPFITLFVELQTHLCASFIFNPVPTIFHKLSVAFVPVGNFYLLLRTRNREFKPNLFDLLVVAIVVMIAAFYSVIFLPFLYAAISTILHFGIGLLPLAPFASLITALFLFRRLVLRIRETGFLHDCRSIWAVGSLGALFCCIAGILWGSTGGGEFFLNLFSYQLF